MNTEPGRKCRLPRENKEGKLDEKNEIWDNDETPEIKHWKEQLASACHSYKNSHDGKKNEHLKLINDAKKKLAFFRCVFYEQILEEISKVDEEERSKNNMEEEWDSLKAETIASHTITSYEKKIGIQHYLTGKTIKYLMRKYGNRENKINLFQYYVNKEKEVNNENRFLEAAHFVWNHIRDVMIDGVGVDIAAAWQSKNLSKQENDYPPHKMQRLKQAMETSEFTGTRNQMGIEYETKTEERRLYFKHQHGYIQFSIQRVGINVDDLSNELYPDNIKSIVTKTISRNPEYSTGLYVSIRVEFDGSNNDGDQDDVDEHCLLLSEFNRNYTKGVYAEGFLDEWLTNEENLLFQSVSVHQPLMNGVKTNYTQWTIHKPLTEHMMFYNSINAMCNLKDVDFYESIPKFKEWIATNNRNKKNVPSELPIQNYVFSGDNFMFIVCVYDLDVPWVLDLFPDWGPVSEKDLKYVSVYALHYPALFLDIDSYMARVEYKNYISVTHGKGNGWRNFKKGQWHGNFFRNNEWKPTDFQDQHDDEKDEDWETIDKNKRKTFPLKTITRLQFHATWDGFQKRRKFKRVQIRDPSNKKSYFVNNLEHDPKVVYRYHLVDNDTTTPIWENFQLFRINAEREVSKYMKSKDLPTFFEERMKWTNDDKKAPNNYFFKQYLEDHEDARSRWVEIWKQEYDYHSSGWVRIDQNRENRDDAGDWGGDGDHHDGDDENGHDEDYGGEDSGKNEFKLTITTKLTDDEKELLKDEGVSSKENLKTATHIKHILDLMFIYAGVEYIDKFAQLCSLMISVYGDDSDACGDFLQNNFIPAGTDYQFDHLIKKIKEERASKVGKKGKKSRAQYQQKPLQKKQEARREPTRASLARQVNANHRAQNTRFLLNLLYTSNSR